MTAPRSDSAESDVSSKGIRAQKSLQASVNEAETAFSRENEVSRKKTYPFPCFNEEPIISPPFESGPKFIVLNKPQFK